MLILLFIFLLLSGCSTAGIILPSDKKSNVQIYSQTYLSKVNRSDKIADKIDGVLRGAVKSTNSKKGYPDYFGGMYIDEEGRLTILTRDIDATRNILSTLTIHEDILYRTCENSFNDLEEAMDFLNDYVIYNDNPTAQNIVGFGIFVKENKIVVILEDDSEAAITDLKNNVSNKEWFSFQKGT